MNLHQTILLSLVVAVIVIVGLVAVVFHSDAAKTMSHAIKKQNGQQIAATKTLQDFLSAVDRFSSTSEQGTKFAITAEDGKSIYITIQQADSGESVVQQATTRFQANAGEYALVDTTAGTVVVLRREPRHSQEKKSEAELEKTARSFLKAVGADPGRIIEEFGSAIEFTSRHADSLHYFTWTDSQFSLPEGLATNKRLVTEVGITSSGYIFSYDNTMRFFHSLSLPALRAICAFWVMPPYDDSSLDVEKSTARVNWWAQASQENRYLLLPYEPDKEFEGCSESAKATLWHLRESYSKQIQ